MTQPTVLHLFAGAARALGWSTQKLVALLVALLRAHPYKIWLREQVPA